MLADQHSISVYLLSEFWIGPAERRGLLFGFAAFNEDEIKEGMQKLASAWGKTHQKLSRSSNTPG
jgi:DNA-binding transcriptional MocR family regulator